MKALISSALSISLIISIGNPISAARAGALGTRPSAPARTALGTIRVEADTKISVPERLVSFSDLTITSANFPTLSREQLSNVYPAYGYGARYNPWTGAYTRGGAVYGPYGGAGHAARYNPRTGTYARGAAAWGPGGARGAGQAWNPRTGTLAQTRQGTNVFAGHDGNVCRNQDGSWQKFDNGSRKNANRGASATSQLNRDFGARMDSAQRTRDLGSINSGRSGRGFSRAGSYRPSGGFRGAGFRGGGGFRGGRR